MYDPTYRHNQNLSPLVIITGITTAGDLHHQPILFNEIALQETKHYIIMETQKFCQSCSMPLDNKEMLGTEKDGSNSAEYCKYCYANGAFINPDMKLDEMKVLVKTQLEKMKAPENVIGMAVNILPSLKRWQNKAPLA